jgi:hypothetical protein
MCRSEMSVRGHQLSPRMDASLQCGCGHVRVMNSPVLVLKCDSQWSTHSFRGGVYTSSSVNTVGEFWKTRHPRSVEVNEICDASFQGQRTHEDLEFGTHELSKSRMRGELDSRTLEVSESRMRDGSESWTCYALKSRIREDSKPWTCEATNFGNLQNSGIWWRMSSGITVHEDFLNENIHELARSKVKVVISRSLGFTCELVARL